MGRAFARPLILPWTWIPTNQSSYMCKLAETVNMLVLTQCMLTGFDWWKQTF